MSLIMDRELVTPGSITGLDAAGTITGATSQAQAFTNGLIAPSLKPAADSTTAVQIQTSAAVPVITVDTTNSRVGIGTTSPAGNLEIANLAGHGTLYVDSRSTSTSDNFGGALYIGKLGAVPDSNKNVGAVWFEAKTTDSITHVAGFRSYTVTGATTRSLMTGNFDIMTKGSGVDDPAVRVRIDENGNVGIGTTAPDTLFHALLTDAGTAAIVNVLTVGHESSGTPAAGFGIGLHLTLESSTTAKQSAALLAASWIVATHASRTARLALSAYDSGGAREGIRIDADGSQALLSFYGVAATARQLLATGAGATVDQVITALQTLGLLKQS